MSERREEAYKKGNANQIRSFRTFGHNKLCPYQNVVLIPKFMLTDAWGWVGSKGLMSGFFI